MGSLNSIYQCEDYFLSCPKKSNRVFTIFFITISMISRKVQGRTFRNFAERQRVICRVWIHSINLRAYLFVAPSLAFKAFLLFFTGPAKQGGGPCPPTHTHTFSQEFFLKIEYLLNTLSFLERECFFPFLQVKYQLFFFPFSIHTCF